MIREPEWTAENMNRKEGDTTFKTCGWCEHTGCGTVRYGCHLNSDCSLLKDYDDENLWNTECLIMKMSKNDIPDLIRNKKYDIKNCLEGIKSAKKEMAVLNKIKNKLSDRPATVDARSEDFNDNDVVYVFHNKKWNRGIVVPGYRSHDGCVSYVLDDYPESKGKPWGCGVGVPCVMSEKDFKWFLSHDIKEFETWIKIQDSDYNGKKLGIEDYIYGMKNCKKEGESK